jgi:hypothetical protein
VTPRLRSRCRLRRSKTGPATRRASLPLRRWRLRVTRLRVPQRPLRRLLLHQPPLRRFLRAPPWVLLPPPPLRWRQSSPRSRSSCRRRRPSLPLPHPLHHPRQHPPHRRLSRPHRWTRSHRRRLRRETTVSLRCLLKRSLLGRRKRLRRL